MTREIVLLGGVLLSAASCSVLYDLNEVQCEVPQDCAAFKNIEGVQQVTCEQGVCAYAYLSTTSAGGSGGGTGGSGSPTSTTNPSSGGSGGSSNSTTSNSTTSSAGSAGAPGCQDHEECIDGEALGEPAICRDGECIVLANDECPVVLGAGDDNESFQSPKNPLIIGAYGLLGSIIPENTAMIANFAFAIDEVNKGTAGGYRVDGVRRPFVAVVCDRSGDLSISMDHLVKTLKVPSMISTLSTKRLLDAFENTDYGALQNDVFIMSAFDADSTLTSPSVDPNGLMWHMLGEATDLAVGYEPLVAQAETYLRTQQAIPPEDPIRVAMIVADTPYLQDIAAVIVDTVEFNETDLLANEAAGDFQRWTIQSASETTNPDLGNTFTELMEFEPHLVLAIASAEFLSEAMWPAIESAWDGTKTTPPPFYLLSSQVPRSSVALMATRFETAPNEPGNPAFIPLRQRILGVITAGAVDTTLYDKYFSKFHSEYGDLEEEGLTLTGTENYYDAAYYTMYAMHGSMANTNMRGQHVSSGMTRLSGGNSEFDVGYDIQEALETLRGTGLSITVHGTMGPPNFNGAGARTSLPGIYCIDIDPAGTDSEMTYYPDVLRYTPETGELTSPSGEDPCSIDGFMEEP